MLSVDATGVIEECCRFLVKERLHITGSRGSPNSSEAVLLLRAVIAGGNLDAYWEYHVRPECQRTHASHYQEDFAPAA